jgi:hypothetical protein
MAGATLDALARMPAHDDAARHERMPVRAGRRARLDDADHAVTVSRRHDTSSRLPMRTVFAVTQVGTAEIALAISIAVALWQFVKYVLEGGRIRLEIRPGVVSCGGALLTGPWAGWTKLGVERLGPRGRYNIEVAVITVANLGRTAVTVSDVGLDFGRSHWWTRHRHSISGQPVPFEGLASTSRTARLDPFDERTYLFEVWSLINAAREGRTGKALRVRASVRVAGKRLRRRSSRRRGWRVVEEQDSLIRGHTQTQAETIYRIAWRHLRQDGGPDVYASVVAAVVEELLEENPKPTKDELTKVVEEGLEHREPFMPPQLIVYDLRRAIDAFASNQQA